MWKTASRREDFIEAVKEAVLRALKQFQKERKADSAKEKKPGPNVIKERSNGDHSITGSH